MLHKLHAALRASKKTLALAESCTGGTIAHQLTALPGASEFFLGSVVAYSNEWKHAFLGVSERTLREHGAVSLETVEEMAQGLMKKTQCDIAAAVSGIAGPTGGTPEKPVGTVCIAVAVRGEMTDVRMLYFAGTRAAIIEQTAEAVLEAIWNRIGKHHG